MDIEPTTPDMETTALLLLLLEAADQIRIFHWQTKGYAEHKALGDLYDALSDGTDSIAETLMGSQGGERPAFDKATIELQNYAEGAPAAYCAELDKQLSAISGLPTDVLNIRDDLLAKVHLTRYLLTLEE